MDQHTYKRVQNKLTRLKLNTAAEALDTVINTSVQNKVSYLDFLDHLLEEEIADREKKSIQTSMKEAKFAAEKTHKEYNFTSHHQLEKKMVMDFFDFTF